MTPWGYLLSLDISRCCPASIRCSKTIRMFSDTLVKRIDMKPFGDPQIVWFGDGPRGGYTLVQLIHTSNICAHFAEESNAAYLDVFSCKPFDPREVEAVVCEHFKPQHIQSHFLSRNAQPELR